MNTSCDTRQQHTTGEESASCGYTATRWWDSEGRATMETCLVQFGAGRGASRSVRCRAPACVTHGGAVRRCVGDGAANAGTRGTLVPSPQLGILGY